MDYISDNTRSLGIYNHKYKCFQVDLIKVWDLTTGTCLKTYKSSGSGVISPKGICVLGSAYVIAAEKKKPLLKVWPINSQQVLHSPRLLCPGKVSVLASSPDGCYIAVGVEEKVHVYQVSSGRLVGSGVYHFQPITVVRWSCDGSILSCGGEDGMVTVWYLSYLMQQQSMGKTDPRYTFTDHTLPVTDLIITSGGSYSRSRLVSVSCDRTCKIYDLSCGKLLLSVVFGEMLTSVSMTPSEMEVLVGTMTGNINEFSLRNPKNLTSSEIHVNAGLIDNPDNIVNVFCGHTKAVTCLSMSLEGNKLLSGSADETVRIWHLLSKQCLKVLRVKGSVTNAFFIKMPKQMLTENLKSDFVLRPFEKAFDVGIGDSTLHIMCNNDLSISHHDIYHENISNDYAFNKMLVASGSAVNGEEHLLSCEVNRLRSINEQLYNRSIRNCLQKRVHDTNENQEIDTPDIGSNENKDSATLKCKLYEKRELDNVTDEIFDKFTKESIIEHANTKFVPEKNKRRLRALQKYLILKK